MANLLIIEPNTLLASTYGSGLQHAGHHVTQVTEAQAGIDAANEQRPDLVILELQLALHSGLEFLHEFRSYVEWRDVPVIVHTALTPPRLAPMIDHLKRNLGVSSVLYKPQTSLQQLISSVREQLAVS